MASTRAIGAKRRKCERNEEGISEGSRGGGEGEGGKGVGDGGGSVGEVKGGGTKYKRMGESARPFF